MEFLIVIELALLAIVIGAVTWIIKMAKRDKQASEARFNKPTDNNTQK